MHVQPRLPLAVLPRPRARSVRRLFHPVQGQGPYRLPRDVHEHLIAALAPFRNRDAAYRLAFYLARFWSAPGRVAEAFHIDRRALSEVEDLGLTERQIRSAIRVLEEIGFLDRALASGSKFKPTEHGLRKKPIKFQFGSEYAPLFIKANERVAARRERLSAAERAKTLVSSHRASTPVFQASPPKCPKNKSVADHTLNLGHLTKTENKSGLPPKPCEPNPKLEAALERFLQEGIRHSRGG